MPPALATPRTTIPFSHAFSTTRPTRASHFDTHLFVQRLQANGLDKEQAEGIMTVLAEVVEESINGMETTMVSKAEQEKVPPHSFYQPSITHAEEIATIHPKSRFRPA